MDPGGRVGGAGNARKPRPGDRGSKSGFCRLLVAAEARPGPRPWDSGSVRPESASACTHTRAHTLVRGPICAHAHIYVRTHKHGFRIHSFIRGFIHQILTERSLDVVTGDTIVAGQIYPDKAGRLSRLVGPGVGDGLPKKVPPLGDQKW